MRENLVMREREEEQIEERDFLNVKENMISFLRHELRRTQYFVVLGEQNKEMRQQRIDYLEGIIDSLEKGHLSLAREYFEKLIDEKEQVVAQTAEDLRRVIVDAKPKIDKLNKESLRLLKQLEIEKNKGNMKKAHEILKEIGNIEDAIGRVGREQEEGRRDLEKAQDDPDLEEFRNFVASIDMESERTIRKI